MIDYQNLSAQDLHALEQQGDSKALDELTLRDEDTVTLCDCGFDENAHNDDTIPERHCCEHGKVLVAPDGCEECFELTELPECVNEALIAELGL